LKNFNWAVCGQSGLYFIKNKKYTRNPMESDRCPEATVGLNQRTVSCPQDRLRTGGLKQETLPLSVTLQLRLQLRYTTPLYRAYFRLPWKIRLPRQLLLPLPRQLLLLLPPIPRLSSSSEPRTSRSIVSRIVNTVQEYQLPSTQSMSYYS
jgi:hypothetical protein